MYSCCYVGLLTPHRQHHVRIEQLTIIARLNLPPLILTFMNQIKSAAVKELKSRLNSLNR